LASISHEICNDAPTAGNNSNITNSEEDSIVLSAQVALIFFDFPAGVESGEGLDAARRKLRRVPRIDAIAGAVNYASVRHIAKYFARAAKL